MSRIGRLRTKSPSIWSSTPRWMTSTRWEHTKVCLKKKFDRLLDGLKSNHFIGLKSNILCNQKMRHDFNTTASHLKDMVNQTPQIKNPPGRQVSAMGRGGGCGRVTPGAAIASTAVSATATFPPSAHSRHLTSRGILYLWRLIHHVL